MRLFALTALMMTSNTVFADQVFLEGFPDVPLLTGMAEESGERMVFDAPSGTVAETSIRSDQSGSSIIDAYAKELPAFGWSCKKQPTNMRCTREQNVLVFLNKTPTEEQGRIILRLEPVG